MARHTALSDGFTLTELTTTLAIIGIISAALIAVMNNLNQQSERMNAQTELLVTGNQLFALVEPWASLAGDRQRNAVLQQSDALVIPQNDQIRFCYDISSADRVVRQFRVTDKRLQMRTRTGAGCAPDSNETGWENISEPLVGDLLFTRASGTPFSLDMRVTLERIVPGTSESVGVTMRKRFNLYSMTRY